MRFETKERLPLQDFPIPAYDLIPLKNYLMLTLQFSSGCPYLLRVLRHPRSLRPAAAAQDAAADHRRARRHAQQQGHPPVVYFVDDNFIGNRKAAKDMLPHLVAWQKQHGYPLQFACEATLNIAKQPEILALMREASFLGMFVGIETPEADALKAMRKDQNDRRADDGVDQDAERLRPGGHLRHHPRPRHRFRRHREPAQGLHRRLADPDADHQPAAGAAEDAAVGPARSEAGRLDGRSGARKQRALPAALRRGGGDVAPLHRLCQRSGAAVRALPPPGRRRPM